MPAALTVPRDDTFTLEVLPEDPRALYELITPGRGTITNHIGNNIFEIEHATINDAGSYFARVSNLGCTSAKSAPAMVTVGGCLSFTVTPHPACANKSRGSITVTVEDQEGPFMYQVKPYCIPWGRAPPPFTIQDIPGNASYTVAVQDRAMRAGVAGPVFVGVKPTPESTLAPLTQPLRLGQPISFIATATPGADACAHRT